MVEEKKPSRREAMYGGKKEKAEHESPAEEKTEGAAGEHKEAQTPDAETPGGGDDMPARHAAERVAMLKSHEGERRELHGQHREEHRAMHGRHEKAHGELNKRHMEEASRGEAAVAGDTPGGEGGAEGGAGEVPQAQAA